MPNLAKFQNHLIQYACPGYLHKNEETNRLKKKQPRKGDDTMFFRIQGQVNYY